jgi:uncharacterized protein (DUF58 family)
MPAAAHPPPSTVPLTPLAPAPMRAPALPARRWSLALAPRALWLIAAGFAPWLLALLWPSWLYALIAWEAVVVFAIAWDASRLPPAGAVAVERAWDGALQIGVASHLRWSLANASRAPLLVWLYDPLAPALRPADAPLSPPAPLRLSPGGSASAGVTLAPRDRGELRLDDVFLRLRSPWALAERWARAPLAASVWVYPDLSAAGVTAGLPLRARQMLALRRARLAGRGREFESLRAYREGDEVRDVCWPATARLGKPVVKLREVERGQSVWLVMDCGRLMRVRASRGPASLAGSISQLDAAANAALALAAAAVQSGDRVGLLACGRRIQTQLPPAGGPLALRRVLDALARLAAEDGEANAFLAASHLLAAQSRRALIVWFTEFADTAQLPAVVEAAAHVAARHLLLLAIPRSASLAAAAAAVPADPGAMYRAAAALELLERRQATLRRLRAAGADALELDPNAMAPALVSAYFEIKARGRL